MTGDQTPVMMWAIPTVMLKALGRLLTRRLDVIDCAQERIISTMSQFQDTLDSISTACDEVAADLGTLGAELQLLLQRLGTETVTQAMIDQGNAIASKLTAAKTALDGLVSEAAPPSEAPKSK
jgi:hypothetical protein